MTTKSIKTIALKAVCAISFISIFWVDDTTILNNVISMAIFACSAIALDKCLPTTKEDII